MAEAKFTKDEIIEFFKEEGLDVAEDVVVAAVRGAFRLIKEIVPRFSSGLGVIVSPMIEYVEGLVLEQVDKIDGEDDEGY